MRIYCHLATLIKTDLVKNVVGFFHSNFTRGSTHKSRSLSDGFTYPSYLSPDLRGLYPTEIPIPNVNSLRPCDGCRSFERIEDNEYCLREKKAAKQLFKCNKYIGKAHG